MFARLRDPHGRPTAYLAAALVLALAGFSAALPLPGALRVQIALLGALAAAGIAMQAFVASRRRRYDLRELEQFRDAETPHEDTIPEDHAATPYCGWCDEVYPPGELRCRRCGREL